MDSPTDKIELGLRRLAQSAHTPDLLGSALVSLHGALEDYARAWIARNHSPLADQFCAGDKSLSWSTVLDLMQRYGQLSRQQRYRIHYAGALRDDVVRGGHFRGTRRDVERFAELVQSILGYQPPAPSGEAPRMHEPRAAGGLRRAWNGRGTPAALLRQICQLALAGSIAAFAYPIGLALLSWRMPLKLAGILILLLAACALARASFSGLRALAQVGLKRLLLGSATIYACAVVVAGVTTGAHLQSAGHWIGAMEDVSGQFEGLLRDAAQVSFAIPSDIRDAATSQPAMVRLPGVGLIIEPPATKPTDALVVPTPLASPTPRPISPPALAHEAPFGIGDTVSVGGTDGVALRARSAPGTTAAVSARFAPNTPLHIVGGPVRAEGRTWWQVRGDDGEGWCAGEYLAARKAATS
jgi:hypothetical protein